MQCTTDYSVQQNAVYNRYIALSVHEHSIELPTYVFVDESLIATLGAANSLVCSTHTYIHTYIPVVTCVRVMLDRSRMKDT